MKLFVCLAGFVSVLLASGAQPEVLAAVVKDRTPHPLLPLESYLTVALDEVASGPRLFTWRQIHMTVSYDHTEKGVGCIILKCLPAGGRNTDHLLLTITEMTQMKGLRLTELRKGERLDLYCMVESTLLSGKTVVMIEKIVP